MTDKVMKAKVRELLKDCHPTYTEKEGTVDGIKSIYGKYFRPTFIRTQ